MTARLKLKTGLFACLAQVVAATDCKQDGAQTLFSRPSPSLNAAPESPAATNNEVKTCNDENALVYKNKDGLLVQVIECHDTASCKAKQLDDHLYAVKFGPVSKHTAVATEAFKQDDDLVAILFPKGVTKIGTEAFYWTMVNPVLDLSDFTGAIEKSAFAGLTKGGGPDKFAQTANKPDYKEFLSKAGFQTNNVDTLLIPKGVTSIGEYAFLERSARIITFEDGFEGLVGALAFSSMEELEEVNIPAGFQFNGRGVFAYNPNLKTVTFNAAFTGEIGEAAFQDSGLTAIHIPAGVSKIGNSAFDSCANLKEVTFGDGFEGTIGSTAFYATDLTEITIPPGTTKIGSEAFFGNVNLKTVDLRNVEEDDVFDRNNDVAQVFGEWGCTPKEAQAGCNYIDCDATNC